MISRPENIGTGVLQPPLDWPWRGGYMFPNSIPLVLESGPPAKPCQINTTPSHLPHHKHHSSLGRPQDPGDLQHDNPGKTLPPLPEIIHSLKVWQHYFFFLCGSIIYCVNSVFTHASDAFDLRTDTFSMLDFTTQKNSVFWKKTGEVASVNTLLFPKEALL